ncbi:MAG: purine-binding chemotaxis protein CheW [Pedosphaera sp.]|nr:purine-binding chemotaxis protein CheW [Pedosphaera sp.]
MKKERPVSSQQSAVSREPTTAQAADYGLLTADSPIHDCWNIIGVEGNATCRELVKFIHCRNCPVYSAAGLQLLDRPLPADYRRERAAHYAQEKKITQPARLSVVIFRLAHEWLALPTNAFVEVAERRAMHSLPHRRRGLALGLVNVRGELLICASLARLLGMEEKTETPKAESRNISVLPISAFSFSRLLVASWDGQRLALPVDEVHGIQRFQKDELKDPPATVAKSTLTYTRGVFAWRDRTVGFLEADALFAALNRTLS